MASHAFLDIDIVISAERSVLKKVRIFDQSEIILRRYVPEFGKETSIKCSCNICIYIYIYICHIIFLLVCIFRASFVIEGRVSAEGRVGGGFGGGFRRRVGGREVGRRVERRGGKKQRYRAEKVGILINVLLFSKKSILN